LRPHTLWICLWWPMGRSRGDWYCSVGIRGSHSSAAHDSISVSPSTLLPSGRSISQLWYRNFHYAVNFKGYGQFINPTRDSITTVVKDNDRIVLAQSIGYKPAAVLITTSVIHSCHVFQPTLHQGFHVKRILVVPLAYEYERLLGWLGLCFGKKQLFGQVNPDVALTFSTRKEGSGSQGNLSLSLTTQYLLISSSCFHCIT